MRLSRTLKLEVDPKVFHPFHNDWLRLTMKHSQSRLVGDGGTFDTIARRLMEHKDVSIPGVSSIACEVSSLAACLIVIQ